MKRSLIFYLPSKYFFSGKYDYLEPWKKLIYHINLAQIAQSQKKIFIEFIIRPRSYVYHVAYYSIPH